MSRKQVQNDRKARAEAVRQAERRRARRLNLVFGSIVGIIVIVLALLVAKSLTGDKKAATPAGSLSPAVAKEVQNVPASVFDKIGVGTAQAAPTPINGTAITADGKPRVLYLGAEYCPFCATERWSMVAALSRFGSFTGLGASTSSSTDVYPSTATLSFHGATYKSKYLSFTGYETKSNQPQGNDYTVLDTPSAADEKLAEKYDAPPYVPAKAEGTIPFVLIGGKYVISGASYDPGVLKGLDQAQIGKDLSDPSSPVATGAIGAANLITASLCDLTGQQPAAVCSSAGVTAAAAKLKK